MAANTNNKTITLSIEDLLFIFEHISKNLSYFEAKCQRYSETPWRLGFEVKKKKKGEGKNDQSLVISENQTKALFSVVSKLIHASNHPHTQYSDNETIINRITITKVLDDLMRIKNASLHEEQKADPTENKAPVKGGRNILISGAPGTGKSHTAKQIAAAYPGAYVVKTVFSQAVDYGTFFGCIEPMTEQKGSTYFAAGPFLEAYAHAISHPHQATFLIIEELTRGNTLEILGEVFALLDRDREGKGDYATRTNPSPRKWLEAKTGKDCSKLQLPENMWILATKNTKDDNVVTLDAGFLRRWEQAYTAFDYSKAPQHSITFQINSAESRSLPYAVFLEKLNTYLVGVLKYVEDRRIGPFYVKPHNFNEDGRLPWNILQVLWDRENHHRTSGLFHKKIMTSCTLHEYWMQNKPIFCEEFIAFVERSVDPSD